MNDIEAIKVLEKICELAPCNPRCWTPGSFTEDQAHVRRNALTAAIAAMKAKSDSVVCPFCQEDDFDLIGLKHHLLSCEEMAKTEAINFIRTRPAPTLSDLAKKIGEVK